MKKLSFKGDTAKKRKRVTKEATGNTVARVAEEAEGWIDAESLEDMSGPIFIVFHYDVPVSLIADARGSLFTMPIDPPLALSEAEPHDVRQVFIASPIVSRGTGTVSLKNGSSGRYVTTDRIGDCKCDKEAIGPAEEWTLVKRPDGWGIQSAYERYLSIDKSGHVRSDVDEIGFCETFKVRIQARNRQKRLKESGATTAGSKGIALLSKKELESKCGRTLTIEDVDVLHRAQKDGSLGEAVLDMRVKGRSDKFG